MGDRWNAYQEKRKQFHVESERLALAYDSYKRLSALFYAAELEYDELLQTYSILQIEFAELERNLNA